MSHPHESNSPHLGRVPTILLADDEPTQRAAAARLLRGGLGCQVYEARNGRHALQLFRRHQRRVDLVLTDFIMPLMDGGELAERVRDLQPGIPVVLMSAPLTGEAATLLSGYSDFPFLQKPFTYLELYRAVAPQLKARATRPWRHPSRPWRHRPQTDRSQLSHD